MEDNVFLNIKLVLIGVTGAFSTAFGWFGWLVLVWIGCMVIDWLTGSAAAKYDGSWKSERARQGIWHKTGMIVVVLVCCISDFMLGMLMANMDNFSIERKVMLTPVVLVWYIVTESGSILENANQMGAKVPGFLIQTLAAGEGSLSKFIETMFDMNSKK